VLASGIAVRLAMDAQHLLLEHWGVAADIWSVTSWNELRRDAIACEEHNLMHPGQDLRTPFVCSALSSATGPVIAVSDWMRAVPDGISRWVPGDWTSLGTDGFGRSDTRAALRRHFRIDPESITVAVLTELARRGEVDADAPRQAIEKYQLGSEDLPGDKDTTEAVGE
jgi:pyruvate dehydrogenase E1 component